MTRPGDKRFTRRIYANGETVNNAAENLVNRKEQRRMTNFEKLSASPEAMAAFLTAIPVANSPWDDDFHRAFCHQCGLEDCDHCPHEAERNNPAWWLAQEAKGGAGVEC